MKNCLLTLMMMLLPMFVSAYDIEVNGIYYDIVSKTKTATVTYKDNSFNTYSGDIIIPSDINYEGVSYSVSAIGWSAFRACSNLKTIVIPNSITSIETSAFYQCKGLFSIDIPESVSSIGDCAFEGCSSLEKISLPDGIEKLSYCLFQFCSNLYSVNIPENVSVIEPSVFRGCIRLSKISIPSGVHTIGGGAFDGCKSLTEISIPNNVTTMGAKVFADCIKLESINIPIAITEISEKMFYNCEQLKEIVLHDNILSIGNYSFEGCKSIEILKIPKNLETIGNYAFSGCENLKEIEFLGNINSIGHYAFIRCKNLVSIVLPNGISSIEDNTFNGCSKLSSIVIPGTVKKIGSLAFANCAELMDFYCYSSTIPQTDNNIFTNSLIEYATLHVPYSVIEEYKAVEPWKGFKEIVAIDMPKYSLIYMVDGEVYKTVSYDFGEVITSEPAPEKEGYTFSGWSEIPETMPDHDVTVTGSFTINKYKLTYIVDGEEYKSFEIEYNSTITPEAEPTKDGYSFSGWTEIPSTMPAKDVTVYGTFTVNMYKLTYMVDNEVYRSYDVEYGATITPEEAPTKENYIFSGWSDIPQTMPAHDVTVTGSFTYAPPKAYTLTYMVDGEVYKTVSYYEGDAIMPEAEPTKEGYTFSGWSEIPETMPAEDVIVKGTFTVNQYILTYVVDGEVYKEYSYDYGSAITPEAEPTKEGYTFSGWSEIPETMPAKEVYVVGNFTINKYKITYVIDGEVYLTEEVEYGSWITPPNPGDHDGYDFAWEDYPDTMPAHDITINGTYTATGIEAVLASEPDVKIFTVSGKPLNKVQKGVNILRYKDGRTRKIVVK